MGRIKDGLLVMGDHRLSSLPIPHETNTMVSIELLFANGSCFSVQSSGFAIRFRGDVTFVESYSC